MNLTEKIMLEAYAGVALYHGTEDQSVAEAIMYEGLKPVARPDKRKSGSMMDPMGGMVYLTRELKYAIIYALGGDMLGNNLPESWIQKSRYGYVFKSAMVEEQNMMPDEDQVGELICNNELPALTDFAKKYLTPLQMRKVMDGEYQYWAHCGKKLNKIMPPILRDKVMRLTKHFAHLGGVQVVEAWRFDKTKCADLAKDGSNFFQLAERVM